MRTYKLVLALVALVATLVLMTLGGIMPGSAANAAEKAAQFQVEHGPIGRISVENQRDALRLMKEGWTNFGTYEGYLIMLCAEGDPMRSAAALRPQVSNGEVVEFRPFLGNFPEHIHPRLLVTIPKYLDDSGNPTGELFGTGFTDPSKALCLVLSDHGDVVPLDAAKQAIQGFVEGFVTRLMVGSLANEWKEAGLGIDPNSFGLSLSRSKEQASLMKEFLKKSNYLRAPDPKNDKMTVLDFEYSMPIILQRHSLHAHGVLTGWQAASELEGLRGSPDEQVLDAARLLVASRYTAYEQGSICSATLNYFYGLTWANGARQAKLRQSGEELGANLTREQMFKYRAETNEQVLTKVQQDPEVQKSRQLVNGLGDAFDAYREFIQHNKEMNAYEREMLLTECDEFLRGWRHGATSAMDECFRIVFRTAADLAYVEGWGDGFSKGYADGYRDGYAAGYAKAWEEANTIIDSLRAQIADLQSVNVHLNARITTLQGEKTSLARALAKAAGGRQSNLERWLGRGSSVIKAASSFFGETTGFGLAKKLVKKLKFW